MRLRMNEDRKRRIENLQEATGEATKSKAIDKAARYYVRMAGNNDAVPTGAVAEIMELAAKQGSVTPEQIADCLDTKELPVTAQTEWSVGDGE